MTLAQSPPETILHTLYGCLEEDAAFLAQYEHEGVAYAWEMLEEYGMSSLSYCETADGTKYSIDILCENVRCWYDTCTQTIHYLDMTFSPPDHIRQYLNKI